MEKDCSTCVYKEGSCYPSTTIFDKDKTCKSYIPDYEGYIAELEKENANLRVSIESTRCAGIELLSDKRKQFTKAKELLREIIDTPVFNQTGGELYENEGYTELVEEAEQFLKENA